MQGVRDERARVREIVVRAVEETEKEHGKPNVYIDMVGELIIEALDKEEDGK